jgi:hypothetical protein
MLRPKFFCVKERVKCTRPGSPASIILRYDSNRFTKLVRSFSAWLLEKQVDKLRSEVKFAPMFEGKNQLPLILTGLLFVCAIVAAVGAICYSIASTELRALQSQAARMESGRNLTRALASEAMEYSKRNPAIDPILQSVGLKPAPASPKAAK